MYFIYVRKFLKTFMSDEPLEYNMELKFYTKEMEFVDLGCCNIFFLGGVN